MALSDSRYFSNSLSGLTMTGSDVNVTEVNALPKFPLGQRYQRADGNVYVYGHFSAATSAGTLVSPTLASSGVATTDNIVVASASAVAVPGDTALPGQVGSRFVEITLASIAADQFAGGYFITEDGSGKGFQYRIKGNTATGNPASGNVRIELYERLAVSLSPNTDIIITPCLWNDLIVNSIATNVMVAGVAAGTTSTSSPFGWVCVHGVTPVLQDASTIAKGNSLSPSRLTSGAVGVYGGSGTSVNSLQQEQYIGYCLQVGASGEYMSAYIML